MNLRCDCYHSVPCRCAATTVIIDAKGRPRLSCETHRTCPEFGYAKDEWCVPVPYAALPLDLKRTWLKAEREHQKALRKKIARLEALVQESEERVRREEGLFTPTVLAEEPAAEVLVTQGELGL